MIDLRTLSRRGFLNMSAAGAAALMLPAGLVRRAFAASPLPAIKEEDAVVGFGHVGPISDEGWTWAHHQGLAVAAYPKLKKVLGSRTFPSADAAHLSAVVVAVCQHHFAPPRTAISRTVVKRHRRLLECDGRVDMDNPAGITAHWYPTYGIGVAAGILNPRLDMLLIPGRIRLA